MVDKGNPNVFTTFKGRFHLEASTVEVWGTNLITNGDFSNGTEGWEPGGATNFYVSNNTLFFTPTTEWGGMRTSSGYRLPSIAGHKYYVANEMKGIDPRACTYLMNINGDGGNSFVGSVAADGIFHRISAVLPCTTSSDSMYLKPQSSAESAWSEIAVRYLIVIDLTAAFGAGNEPTAEQMDAYLAAYPNSWFDGSALLTTSGIPSHTVDSDVVMLSCTNDVQPIGDWTLNDYTANSPFSTLPSECRPLKTLKIPVVVNDGIDRIAVLTVNTDGTMSLPFDYATATLFISGVNFNISDNWY